MTIVEVILHYQRSLAKCPEDEERILHCVSKLYNLPITVQHLQDTGIGKTVNALRKYEGECGDAAKACVAKWKAMVAAEESSDQETEQHAPEEPDESPPDAPSNEKHRTSNEKSRSRSHRDEPNSKRIKEDRSSSNGRENNHKEVSKSSNKREESSTNKIRDKSRDVDREKRHYDKVVSSCSSSSASNSRNNADESSKKMNGIDKHKEKSHSSSRSVSTERKSESSKRDDSSSRNDCHGDKKTSSKMDEEVKQKKRDEEVKQKNRDEEVKQKKRDEEVKQKKRDEEVKRKKRDEEVKHKKRDEEVKHKKRDEEANQKKRERSPHGSKDRAKASTSGEKVICSEKSARHSDATSLKSKERKTEATCNGENRSREKERRKDPDRKMTAIRTGDGSIDSLSGASFAEALGMVNPTRRSPVTTSRSPSKPSPTKQFKSSASSSRRYADSSPADFDFPSPSSNLEPLDCDLAASIELPAINPHYRPLPNAYNPFDSPPPSKKMKSVSEEEKLGQLMYHKAERTRVYSGVKGSRRGSQPASLFDNCVRVLQDNIHLLGYTGGVPYSILKPVLEKATAEQLLDLEHDNPYIVEESDELWEFHVSKQFRTLQRQEMESYRELFMRGLDERAAKLEALKSNIKQSQATSVPVRKAKMTYMDSVAKPPREVARQQARNGTARPVPRGIPGPASSPSASRAAISVAKQKPRVAPLMQKAMKFAKTFKR